MPRWIELLSILVRENLVPGSFPRQPEECLVMDGAEQVEAWHRQGADEGPITPVYHLVARACSRLTPAGGTVVDLGCGTGRFAAYLARLRPDLSIVGLDLSGPMVATGNAALQAEGLAGRVRLLEGDMTSFIERIPPRTSLVSSLFAMHHLPSLADVSRCFAELRRARERAGCGVVVFDLARPRHRRTAVAYPAAFTPDAPEVFRLDSTNSLLAAYRHTELLGAMRGAFDGIPFAHARARLLPLYQAFWVAPSQATAVDGERGKAADRGRLAAYAMRQYRALRWTLPALPN